MPSPARLEAHCFPEPPWRLRRVWPSALIDEVIYALAARRSRSPAVLCDGRILTYGELVPLADMVAGRLREHGVGPGSIVGVCLPRSIEQVLTILGVLRAGGAFMPLDLDLPPLRIDLLIHLAGARILVANQTIRAASAETLLRFADLARQSDGLHHTPSRRDPDDLAYVVCTSGSTGSPKAIGITHRQFLHQFHWRSSAFGLGPGQRLLYKAPFSTDVAVGEMLNSLSAGALMIILPPDAERDPDLLVRIASEAGVTVMYFVSSSLESALDADLLERVYDLRVLNVGAEPLLAALRDRVTQFRPGILWHTYGPTECTITTLASRCGHGGEVTLDHPCTNVIAWVRSEDGQPVAPGSVGELYLGGPQVANGYLGDPNTTAASFATDPGGTGRIYRTGDLFRVCTDGRLVFVGRRDNMVKVGGWRITVEEIEAALLGSAAVRQAAVVPVQGEAGDLVLNAFVVLRDGACEATVQCELARWLPSYARPRRLIAVSELPVLPAGKVDRRRLAATWPALSTVSEVGAGGLEGRLGSMWAELLGTMSIDGDRDLGQYGLNSLTLLRARSRIMARFGVKIGMRELFAARTVRMQAELIANMSDGEAAGR